MFPARSPSRSRPGSSPELKAKVRSINWNPYPASAQILCDAVGIEFRPLSLPQGNAGVSDNVRFAYTGSFILKGDVEQALAIATRGTNVDAPSKLKALALCAEWMPDPARALDAAVVVVSGRGKLSLSQSYTLRLAQIGFASGNTQQAKDLANSLTDDGLKAWAFGDGVHQRALVSPTEKADEASLETPGGPDKLKAGHLWGRLWVARQNARVSGDRNGEKGVVAGWSPEVLQPCRPGRHRAGVAGPELIECGSSGTALVSTPHRRSSLFGPLVWWELARLARRGHAARSRVLILYGLLLTALGFAVVWSLYHLRAPSPRSRERRSACRSPRPRNSPKRSRSSCSKHSCCSSRPSRRPTPRPPSPRRKIDETFRYFSPPI